MFNTRPRLSNDYVQQGVDDVLDFNGRNNFEYIYLEGIEVAVGSDLVNGYVLGYDGTSIKLIQASGGGTTNFDGRRPTTRSGIPVVTAGTDTVTDFLEKYFFPAVPPTATLTVVPNSRQYGDSTTGNLSYVITKNTNNIQSAIVNGQNITNPNTNLTGSVPYTVDSANYNNTGTSATQTYTMTVISTANEQATASASIVWSNRRYFFKSSNLFTASDSTAIGTLLRSLTSTSYELSTTKTKTLTNYAFSTTSEYFYYAYPKIFGVPNFTVNGLSNNAWGSSEIGTLFEISFTNSNGYTTTYYIARSDNKYNNTSMNIGIS